MTPTDLQRERKLSKAERAALFDCFGGRCAYCGSQLGARWHADHVNPVIRRTTYEKGRGFVQTGEVYRAEHNTVANFMPACAPCNIDKGPHSLEGWREQLARTLDIMARDHPIYRKALRMGFVTEVRAPIVFWFERQSLTPVDRCGDK